MSIEDILKVITNVGFPMTLCIYLLMRFEQKLAELTKMATELSNAVNILTENIRQIQNSKRNDSK